MITRVNFAFVLLICFVAGKTQTLNEFKPFEGCWQLQNSKESVFECYKTEPPAILGKSFSVNHSDTSIIEKTAILQSMQKWYLSAQVTNQNNGRIILFELIGKTGNTFLFENKMHDFPQKIVYQFVSDTEMEAEISGIVENKIKITTFKFLKTTLP